MNEDRLTRLENAIAALADRQIRTDRQIAALVERQAATDVKIASTQSQINELAQVFRGIVQRIEANQRDTNSQILGLIEESRDMKNWLRATQENIQSIFTEIRQLWERVNAS